MLRRVSEHGAYADRAFRAEAERAQLSARERAFAQRLAYGAIQRRATLEHVLARLAARPLRRIDAPLRDALSLGILQLVFMDAVADHAAVSETVELAKLETHAAGFANAVMRRAAREGPGLVRALDDTTPASAALRHSHPDWLVRMWWEMLGPEGTRALLERDNEPGESAARANELRVTRDELRRALLVRGVVTRPAPGLPEGLVLERPFDLHGSDLFDAGAVMPQSRGSMLVARLLDPQPGERVLDMCAAPGAKTTQLAALMRDRGEIVALERHAGRAQSLAANCRRLGVSIAHVVTADAAAPLPGSRFDRVLLDAPCSDLGTLQARPDARWQKSPEQIRALAQTQRRLLEAAAARVRPGGTLIYSTCTISSAENEEVVRSFLDAQPLFHADDLGAAHARARDPRFLQLLPHRDLTDGFFVARLRRTR